MEKELREIAVRKVLALRRPEVDEVLVAYGVHDLTAIEAFRRLEDMYQQAGYELTADDKLAAENEFFRKMSGK